MEGKKTQTRRVINAPVLYKVRQPDEVCFDGKICSFKWRGQDVAGGFSKIAPYQPGDVLWVKEKWCNINKPEFEPEYYYFADIDSSIEDYDSKEWKWYTPIHMPRKAARIFLRVTDVRVERLQDIKSRDAEAEGVERLALNRWRDYRGIEEGFMNPVASFVTLWDSLNAKRGYGWDANPWVWVIEFENIEPKR